MGTSRRDGESPQLYTTSEGSLTDAGDVGVGGEHLEVETAAAGKTSNQADAFANTTCYDLIIAEELPIFSSVHNDLGHPRSTMKRGSLWRARGGGRKRKGVI